MSGAGNDLTQPADGKVRAFRSGTNPTAQAHDNHAAAIQNWALENPVLNRHRIAFVAPTPYAETEVIDMHVSGLNPFMKAIYRSLHNTMYLGHETIVNEITETEFNTVSTWALKTVTNTRAAEHQNLTHAEQFSHIDDLIMPASITNLINATGPISICEDAFKLVPQYGSEPKAMPYPFPYPLHPTSLEYDAKDGTIRALTTANVTAALLANIAHAPVLAALNAYGAELTRWGEEHDDGVLPTDANAHPLIEKYSLFVNSMAENGYLEIGTITEANEGNNTWILNANDAVTQFPNGNAQAIRLSHVSGVADKEEIYLAAIVQDRNRKITTNRSGFRFYSPVINGVIGARTQFASGAPDNFF